MPGAPELVWIAILLSPVLLVILVMTALRRHSGGTTMKNKSTAAWLSFLLGGIGAHHFYLGNPALGVLYLVFCWTYVPGIIAFIECIVFITMSHEQFDANYNRGAAGVAEPVSRPQVVVNVNTGPGQVSVGAPQPQPLEVPEYRRRRPATLDEQERFVLLIARDLDAVLTPADVVTETHMSFSEAKATLELLHKRGACEIDVTYDGELWFRFPSLQRRLKAAAAAPNQPRLTSPADDSLSIDS